MINLSQMDTATLNEMPHWRQEAIKDWWQRMHPNWNILTGSTSSSQPMGPSVLAPVMPLEIPSTVKAITPSRDAGRDATSPFEAVAQPLPPGRASPGVFTTAGALAGSRGNSGNFADALMAEGSISLFQHPFIISNLSSAPNDGVAAAAAAAAVAAASAAASSTRPAPRGSKRHLTPSASLNGPVLMRPSPFADPSGQQALMDAFPGWLGATEAAAAEHGAAAASPFASIPSLDMIKSEDLDLAKLGSLGSLSSLPLFQVGSVPPGTSVGPGVR